MFNLQSLKDHFLLKMLPVSIPSFKTLASLITTETPTGINKQEDSSRQARNDGNDPSNNGVTDSSPHSPTGINRHEDTSRQARNDGNDPSNNGVTDSSPHSPTGINRHEDTSRQVRNDGNDPSNNGVTDSSPNSHTGINRQEDSSRQVRSDDRGVPHSSTGFNRQENSSRQVRRGMPHSSSHTSTSHLTDHGGQDQDDISVWRMTGGEGSDMTASIRRTSGSLGTPVISAGEGFDSATPSGSEDTHTKTTSTHHTRTESLVLAGDRNLDVISTCPVVIESCKCESTTGEATDVTWNLPVVVEGAIYKSTPGGNTAVTTTHPVVTEGTICKTASGEALTLSIKRPTTPTTLQLQNVKNTSPSTGSSSPETFFDASDSPLSSPLCHHRPPTSDVQNYYEAPDSMPPQDISLHFERGLQHEDNGNRIYTQSSDGDCQTNLSLEIRDGKECGEQTNITQLDIFKHNTNEAIKLVAEYNSDVNYINVDHKNKSSEVHLRQTDCDVKTIEHLNSEYQSDEKAYKTNSSNVAVLLANSNNDKGETLQSHSNFSIDNSINNTQAAHSPLDSETLLSLANYKMDQTNQEECYLSATEQGQPQDSSGWASTGGDEIVNVWQGPKGWCKDGGIVANDEVTGDTSLSLHTPTPPSKQTKCDLLFENNDSSSLVGESSSRTSVQAELALLPQPIYSSSLVGESKNYGNHLRHFDSMLSEEKQTSPSMQDMNHHRCKRRRHLEDFLPVPVEVSKNLNEETRKIMSTLANDRVCKVARPSLGLQDRLASLAQRSANHHITYVKGPRVRSTLVKNIVKCRYGSLEANDNSYQDFLDNRKDQSDTKTFSNPAPRYCDNLKSTSLTYLKREGVGHFKNNTNTENSENNVHKLHPLTTYTAKRDYVNQSSRVPASESGLSIGNIGPTLMQPTINTNDSCNDNETDEDCEENISHRLYRSSSFIITSPCPDSSDIDYSEYAVQNEAVNSDIPSDNHLHVDEQANLSSLSVTKNNEPLLAEAKSTESTIFTQQNQQINTEENLMAVCEVNQNEYTKQNRSKINRETPEGTGGSRNQQSEDGTSCRSTTDSDLKDDRADTTTSDEGRKDKPPQPRLPSSKPGLNSSSYALDLQSHIASLNKVSRDLVTKSKEEAKTNENIMYKLKSSKPLQTQEQDVASGKTKLKKTAKGEDLALHPGNCFNVADERKYSSVPLLANEESLSSDTTSEKREKKGNKGSLPQTSTCEDVNDLMLDKMDYVEKKDESKCATSGVKKIALEDSPPKIPPSETMTNVSILQNLLLQPEDQTSGPIPFYKPSPYKDALNRLKADNLKARLRGTKPPPYPPYVPHRKLQPPPPPKPIEKSSPEKKINTESEIKNEKADMSLLKSRRQSRRDSSMLLKADRKCSKSKLLTKNNSIDHGYFGSRRSSKILHLCNNTRQNSKVSFGQDQLRKCLEKAVNKYYTTDWEETMAEEQSAESKMTKEELNKALRKAVCYHDAEKARSVLKFGADPNMKCGHSTVLNRASKDGSLYVLQALLAAGADIDVRTEQGNSPLHLAAKEGHSEVAVQLVESGAFVDAINRSGVTPLQMALAHGQIDVVRRLIRMDADMLLQNKVGESAEDLATQLGYMGLSRFPREVRRDSTVGTKVENTSSDIPVAVRLIKGIEEGCAGTVESCLKEGGGPNTLVPLALHWPARASVLHRASHHGQDLIVRLLLASNSDINSTDVVGNTPLHAAAQAGHNRVVKILLNASANLQATSNSGMTPLHRAASKGKELTCNLLLKRGANAQAEDLEGRTPGDWARKRGFTSLAKKLAYRRKSSASLLEDNSTMDCLQHLQRLHQAALRASFTQFSFDAEE